MPDIICNRIRTPDGTIIESKHGHDYVCHDDANGFTYCVDGGKNYLRRASTDGAPVAEELSVYSDDLHKLIRETMRWGTRGVNGDQPIRYILLKEMTAEHIKACLETQPQMLRSYRNSMMDELEFRKSEF